MHPALKILVGAIMVVVGVFSTVTFFSELVTLAKAGIGPLLVVIGAFIIWLESDEWKMRREQQRDTSVQQQFQQAQEPQTQTEARTEPERTGQMEEEEDEGYSCPECGKTFDTERGMNIHRAQKHE